MLSDLNPDHQETFCETTHRELVSEMIMSMMGVDRFAYIKRDALGDFTVHAADGTPLATFESQEEAFISICKYNLTPVQIH